MDKHVCIKTISNSIGNVFEKGKFYEGRYAGSYINISPYEGFNFPYTFTTKRIVGYDWVYSDYFITLAEHRDKQIEEILN